MLANQAQVAGTCKLWLTSICMPTPALKDVSAVKMASWYICSKGEYKYYLFLFHSGITVIRYQHWVREQRQRW